MGADCGEEGKRHGSSFEYEDCDLAIGLTSHVLRLVLWSPFMYDCCIYPIFDLISTASVSRTIQKGKGTFIYLIQGANSAQGEQEGTVSYSSTHVAVVAIIIDLLGDNPL
ncbi:hypothetical protein ACJX0J_022997 [Zea mays]